MSRSLPPFTNALTQQLNQIHEGPCSYAYNLSDSSGSNQPGPRPLVEPAVNPKRQKNREAQRAHCERKERYIKDLEYDSARLKQHLVQIAQERDLAFQQRNALAEENFQMRNILESFRLSLRPQRRMPELPPPSFSAKDALSSTLFPCASVVTSGAKRLSLEPMICDDDKSRSVTSSDSAFTNSATGTLDYDAIALDFVLSLERPCMKHVQYLVSRANNPTGQAIQLRPSDVPDDGENEEISGHALMASCPPPSPLGPFLYDGQECRVPDIDTANLTRLLGLSERLPGLDDEQLPPIKAWVKLREDERFSRLSSEDFQELKRKLLSSVQCYRFGSVLPAYLLEDAMASVCGTTATTQSGKSV